LKSFPVVISDQSANFNLAFRFSKSSFVEVRSGISMYAFSCLSDIYLYCDMSHILIFQLQAEASATLDCIQKCRDNGFEEVFLTKCDFPAKYDYCMRYSHDLILGMIYFLRFWLGD